MSPYSIQYYKITTKKETLFYVFINLMGNIQKYNKIRI